ncbi:MAG TPA: hypothetical protein VMV44_15590 [Rectinemataceae bacterium]|nr:hypothetical protein [Rectinemataceae bacterium]
MKPLWIKWYPVNWLHSTARDEMDAAQRSTFQDFVCLAAISKEAGSFKFVSIESLSRMLNTETKVVESTIKVCLDRKRISIRDDAEGKVMKILKWKVYQSFTSVDDKPRKAQIKVNDKDDCSSLLNTNPILLTLKEDIRYLWCEFARRHGLTEIKDILKGSKRERTLNARLEDKGFDFKALLAKVEESPFLLGKKTDFKATFDWILAPSNYQKIIEGNYRGTTPFDGPREWLKKQEEKDHGND